MAARAITIGGVHYNAGDTVDTTGWDQNVLTEYIRLGWLATEVSDSVSINTLAIAMMVV